MAKNWIQILFEYLGYSYTISACIATLRKIVLTHFSSAVKAQIKKKIISSELETAVTKLLQILVQHNPFLDNRKCKEFFSKESLSYKRKYLLAKVMSKFKTIISLFFTERWRAQKDLQFSFSFKTRIEIFL